MSSDGDAIRQQTLLSVSAREVKLRATGDQQWTTLSGPCTEVLVIEERDLTENRAQGCYIVARRLRSQTGDPAETLVNCGVLTNLKYTVSSPTFHYFTLDRESECGIEFPSEKDAIQFSLQVIEIKENATKTAKARRTSRKSRSRKGSSSSTCEQLPVHSSQTTGGKISSSPIGPVLVQPKERPDQGEATQPLSSNKEVVDGKQRADIQDSTPEQGTAYVQFFPQDEIIEKKKEKLQDLEKAEKTHYYSQIKDDEKLSKEQPEHKEVNAVILQPRSTKEEPKQVCSYCGAKFSVQNNPPGTCGEAPSKAQDVMKILTCYKAADCITYHCAADSDGEYGDPFECNCSDDLCRRRWSFLCCLGCCIPCIFCYIPMRCCLKIGARFHLCGGRHAKI